MGRKKAVEAPVDAEPAPTTCAEEAPVKQKKECSPELLERLAKMRIKAQEKKAEKAIVRNKAKLYKQEKFKEIEADAKKYEEAIKSKQPEPEPVIIKKKKTKKVIVEEVSSDDDDEEEVVIKKVIKKKAPYYPQSSNDSDELGRLTRNAINEQLRQKVNDERLQYISNLLKPSYY